VRAPEARARLLRVAPSRRRWLQPSPFPSPAPPPAAAPPPPPPERYILWEAEDAGLELPYACRMGCCTACAVRVKSGEVRQVEALGVSQDLRDAGYALMCVGFPTADCELEVVDEDEVYELQVRRGGGGGCRGGFWGGRGAQAVRQVALQPSRDQPRPTPTQPPPHPQPPTPNPPPPRPPQFGRYFEEYALNPNAASVERDDFALEIAQMDE
jgi:2Fe-2S type ferredoxin